MNEWIEKMKELEGDEALYPSGFEKAIVGIVFRHPEGHLFLMSGKKIIEKLVADGMMRHEAVEYYEFNIKFAYLGEGTPVYLEDDE